MNLLRRYLKIQLGIIEVIQVNKKQITKYSLQPFDYLLVLDFESTCWGRSDHYQGPPEIIEFPTVIYDVKKNKIVEEFQQYVMPMEMPKLSEFCTDLTGITQHQVDNGVPLKTCLMLFKKWVAEQLRKYNMVIPSSAVEIGKKKCIFVTWSDWDLGTCLKNECKRKSISKPDMFLKWIDLRALYKEHYNRRPQGLKGALTEVGLNFKGREHCGLHDSRNTAALAARMIADGVLLRITKDISPKFL